MAQTGAPPSPASTPLTPASAVASPIPFAAALPPELFARDAEYETAKISPDGRYLAATKMQDGLRCIVVLELATLNVSHELRFNPPNEVAGFVWAKDHRLLASPATHVDFLDAPVLTGELWGVDADGSAARMVYAWRTNLAPSAPEARGPARVLSLLPEDPTQVVIANHTPTRNGASLTTAYLLDIYSGKLRKIVQAPLPNATLVCDAKGAVRLAFARAPDLTLQIQQRLASSPDGSPEWQPMLSAKFGDGELLPLALAPGASDDIFALDNRDTDATGLWRVDLRSGTRTPLFVQPGADIDRVSLSAQDATPYAVRFLAAGHPHYALVGDERPESALLRKAVAAFADQDVELTSVTRDGALGVLRVRSDRDAGTIYLIAKDKAAPEFLLGSRRWLPPSRMAAATVVNIPSDIPSDIPSATGTPLPGYLWPPIGDRPRPWPLVVLVHGGPHGARDDGLFDPLVQMLAQQGYAVLQINYRGSPGFGRQFLDAGYGQWNGGIIRDVAAATRWAIAAGDTDAQHVCVMGASFGGFAATAVALQFPALYRCVISASGIYDLNALPHVGDMHRWPQGATFVSRVSGADARSDLPRRAPDMQAAVLLVHGAADQRAPVAQARRMRDALASSHKRVEYLEVPKAGHGFASPADLAAYYTTVIAFLNKHIGTRGAVQSESAAETKSQANSPKNFQSNSESE